MWACRPGRWAIPRSGTPTSAPGRVVAMDLGAIDLAIEDGSFAAEPRAPATSSPRSKAAGGTAHLMGVVSDGGVHGACEPHPCRLPRDHRAWACRSRCTPITDGRDVPPRSRRTTTIDELAAAPARGRAASPPSPGATGRWTATIAGSGSRGLRRHGQRQGRSTRARPADRDPRPATARARPTNSSPPPCIDGYRGQKDGDGLFCLNFRADRAREILPALGDPAFSGFDAGTRPKLVRAAGDGRLFRPPTTPT